MERKDRFASQWEHVSEFKYLGFVLGVRRLCGSGTVSVTITSPLNDWGLQLECRRVQHEGFHVPV